MVLDCVNKGFPQHRASYLLLLPLRMAVSKVAIKSVMTASASFKPARTEMTSELGLVYFLVRAASRKTVKVWPVSLGLYRMAAVCVPRARPRLRGASPALHVVWRGARVVASAIGDAAFRRAVQSPVCASGPLSRTLNNVSYSRMILGWKISGRESWVSGDGSIAL
jgi:hypothetical protein